MCLPSFGRLYLDILLFSAKQYWNNFSVYHPSDRNLFCLVVYLFFKKDGGNHNALRIAFFVPISPYRI